MISPFANRELIAWKKSIEEVRAVLQRFQDGYLARDVTKLDEFMTLFAPEEDIWSMALPHHSLVNASGLT